MYLIDGNNLMGRTPGIGVMTPDARRRLLHRLAAFRNLSGHRRRRITVVFDGAPEPQFPHGSSFQGVRILYAQPHSSADDVIRNIVAQQRDRRALTVVTSDRELYGYVRACGIRALTCEQFNDHLDAILEAAGAEEKEERELSRQEIDEWMRYFGITGEQGSQP
ncbi:MAG: hypothetical protein D6723_09985 [Acidobacteria bacterium]|nr:MAG: hypothetical protein D6723_09985 [Acidobacteriota bacterium]